MLLFSLAILGYGGYRITVLAWMPHGAEWLGFVVGSWGVVEGLRRLRGVGRFARGWKPAPGTHRSGFLVGAGFALGAALFGRPTFPVFIVYSVVTCLCVVLYLVVKRKGVALPRHAVHSRDAAAPLKVRVVERADLGAVVGSRPGVP